MRLLRACLWWIAGCLVSTGVAADEAAAWAALREGHAIALMRHTDAPGGFGDPPGFRLDDCTTQRNLSAQGRAHSKAIGARLKAQKIAIAALWSSPWCRCVDTATLLGVGPVRRETTFGNVVVLADQRDALTAGAQRLLAGWSGPGNLLVVTHGANIQALLGGANPMSGETVVVRRQADGSLAEIGRIPPPTVHQDQGRSRHGVGGAIAAPLHGLSCGGVAPETLPRPERGNGLPPVS